MTHLHRQIRANLSQLDERNSNLTAGNIKGKKALRGF